MNRLLLTLALAAALPAQAGTVSLHHQWKIQDSSLVAAEGALVSSGALDDRSWTAAVVPSTVLGNLVPPTTGMGGEDDPFFGENLLKLPGSGAYYPIGKNYGEVVTPPESPFGRGWWYRRSFTVQALAPGEHVDVDFFGITYGAEIWLNGRKVADSSATRGSYRTFSFDVTRFLAAPGAPNWLAVLVFPPQPTDLTPSWVDWNPTPQDKNMGLWREVTLRVRGPVRLDHPLVTSEIDLPRARNARLTVEAVLTNSEPYPVRGRVVGTVADRSFEQEVELAAGERRTVRIGSAEHRALKLRNPLLWWPWQMGEPALYHLSLAFEADGRVSDRSELDFGIRKIESRLTKEGARLFTINGKPIQIRGGGWASDLFLRFSKQREERELRYVRDLGLNTVRLEGRFEPQSFLRLADRMGMLVMPGWVCCNAWQDNQKWSQENYAIASASIRDQIFEFRAHPSVLTFLYGSDEAPPPAIEKIYTDAFAELSWPNPIVASAAATNTPGNGKSGFKMNGPYDYTPPSYWYVDKEFGGAFGFNTETSPGASMPPLESLRKFIPEDHLSRVPSGMDDTWLFHTGENDFHSLKTLQDAVNRRLGGSRDVSDFVEKAQLLAFDNHRAMFEAFGRNKYRSATGLIQWMLNSAWPSLIWHLWDYELRPDAAYYGVKKATAPIHVQYSYDDQSIVLVNSTYSASDTLRVSARVFDLGLNLVEKKDMTSAVEADSSKRVFSLHIPGGKQGQTYFVKLELRDESGSLRDENFYWLSNLGEVYDWQKTDFKATPLVQEADLSGLSSLSLVQVQATLKWSSEEKSGRVRLSNPGHGLAFFIRTRLMQNGREILPVYWKDNYISLLPGETRTVEVSAPDADEEAPVEIEGEGWNAKIIESGLR